MELRQFQIHRKYNKAESKVQITIGDDYSVSDGKPDISSILQKNAELFVEEVHTEKGKIKIRGKLCVNVLYLAERSVDKMACLEMEFPFDEVMYMEGAVSGDNLKIYWNIDELRVTMVHPGKLSVRALVTLQGTIAATENYQITEAAEAGNETQQMQETFVMADPVLERKDSYRMRDEVLLPANKPNVQDILWKNLQVRGLELRPQEGKLAVKGEALLWVVYQTEEEPAQIQWLEQSIPFQGNLEVPELTSEMFGLMDAEIAHRNVELKPDYDGEMRMFQIELLLDIHMHVYGEQTCQLLKDVYSTKELLAPVFENAVYEKLRMCNQAKCRVSRKENLGDDIKILQVVGHQAKLQEKGRTFTDQGIVCEGTIEVQVLYITASDRQPFENVTIQVPYSQLIEIPGITKEDVWKVTENLEQLFVHVSDSSQLEIRAVIHLNVCVMEQCKLQNIVAVDSGDYDMESYKKRPGMMIHFVQPRETLWEIAKENRTTMDEIMKLNDLSVDEVTPGQKLLLLKTIVEPVVRG